MTLHFLGDVPSDRITELANCLSVSCYRMAVELDHMEQWAHGLCVLAPSELPEALIALHTRLAETLIGLGAPVETRAFRPHVTLARHASKVQAPVRYPRAAHWVANAYALAASEGGHYRVLRRYSST